MQPLSIGELQKHTLEEVHAFTAKAIDDWHRANHINNIQAYCNRIGTSAAPMISELITAPVPPDEPKTCKGFIKSSSKKCWKPVKPGCEYCGFHKKFEKKNPKPPPARYTHITGIAAELGV